MTEKLGAADVARYAELESTIKDLTTEFTALQRRFKDEIQPGKFPTANGFQVHRWNQIGALDGDKFTQDFPVEEHDDLYSPVPDVAALVAAMPPAEHPDLYTLKPDVGAVKEAMFKEPADERIADASAYFASVPYLKITPLES
jgi:hypothetical protein